MKKNFESRSKNVFKNSRIQKMFSRIRIKIGRNGGLATDSSREIMRRLSCNLAVSCGVMNFRVARVFLVQHTKMAKITTKYFKLPLNIPNGRKMYQMAICKTYQHGPSKIGIPT
jgi:hypothetical protein